MRPALQRSQSARPMRRAVDFREPRRAKATAEGEGCEISEGVAASGLLSLIARDAS